VLRATIFFLILGAFSASQALASESASYRVTFEADWSQETHPISFPSNPHFSGLIGATHNDQAVLWRSGELASDGIEQMAETGGKSMLLSEISSLAQDDLAGFLLSGGGIANSPGSVSLEFSINRSHPLVSLVTMIAPSPDWFVGVDSLPLRDNGQWIEELSVELQAYDSGTDSGRDYESSNADTQPAEPIFHIFDSPFQDQVPLGRFVFELLSSSGDLVLDGSMSGQYHDPQRSGEGINMLISQVGERTVVFITWFTYFEDEPIWMVGAADINPGDTLVEMDLFRTRGTGFGPMFDPEDVELIPWGDIRLSIPACGLLDVDYASIDPAFGSATVQLELLVGIAGSPCE
jgi:hypothetical protein